MSTALKIALLQLMPGPDLNAQICIGEAACRQSAALGADIALFPEMWSCGYQFPQDPAALRSLAVPADGPYVAHFDDLARELNMAIGITLLEDHRSGVRNTLVLLDRHGAPVLTYAKVHTCAFGDERVLTPGDAFYTVDLDTAKGMVRTGAMVCYDREFPESARVLMLQGAELILVPNACPMELNRLSQLRARAFENMAAIATCNYPAGQPDCNGRSTLMDGMAWLHERERDMCVLEAPGEPGIYLAELDLEALRTYRAQEAFGDAYRRPSKYGILLEKEPIEPFVRADRLPR